MTRCRELERDLVAGLTLMPIAYIILDQTIFSFLRHYGFALPQKSTGNP